MTQYTYSKGKEIKVYIYSPYMLLGVMAGASVPISSLRVFIQSILPTAVGC